MFQSHSKKIPFVLLLLLPSFARTVQVSSCHPMFMICRTAAYILTAVLTLYLPDSSDLLPEDSQLGAERRKQCRGTRCYSPRPLWRSISSCSQDCAIYATSSFFPSASTHLVIVTVAPVEVAAITVKLFDRHCWLIWGCFTSKKPYLACGMERRLWTARTPVSSHWPPHRTGRRIALAAAYALTVAHRMQRHLFAVQPVICSLKHKPLRCGVPGDGMQ
jgi:hypothetical protein